MKRREFIKLSGLGATAVICGNPARMFGQRMLGAQQEVPDIIINLRAVQTTSQILSGPPTNVWKYEGDVVQGPPETLQPVPDSYLGPTIRVARGQTIRINFTNNLPETTLMHWHGFHISPVVDAHPRYTVAPGQSYAYEFQVTNRAGTYWYHPHPDMLTGGQAYRGLAGLFLVSDDEEAGLNLPSGEFDVPIVLQDRTFDANNQLVYQTGGMTGFIGDTILVTGRMPRYLPVASRAYRLRFLNGSNSRAYKLAWSDSTPFTVIASDGGLLETAVQRPYIMLAPGERVEVIADLRHMFVGQRKQLISRAFSPMGNAGGGGALPNGAPFTIMNFRCRRRMREDFVLPERLSTIVRYRLEDAINRDNPRVFPISMGMPMRWVLNGGTFEMETVAANEIVRLNTLEVWDLTNQAGMMQMYHPIHVHGLQFQVIERQMLPSGATAYEGVRYGYVDAGWKDTVMLMPGERVRFLLKFEDFIGKYVYHCHILEHEDMGMMRNYEIRP